MNDTQAIEVLEHLRQARALVSHDSEALHLGTLTLERIAHIAGANVGFTLGQCAPGVLSLLAESPSADQISGRELFETVLQARNMAIHGGAWVRHHTTRLVDLFLLLEQAISTKMKVIEQIMVRAPLEAKPWHVLGHARNDMLRNSFSALPIFIGPPGNQRWKLLRDDGIVRLISGKRRSDREKLLSQPIAQAVANGLEVTEAEVCAPRDSTAKIAQRKTWPQLVIDRDEGGPDRLVGIVTPFDLL